MGRGGDRVRNKPLLKAPAKLEHRHQIVIFASYSLLPVRGGAANDDT
jgi:hypothetical protein